MNSRKYEPKCQMFKKRVVTPELYNEMSKEFGVEITADKVWYTLTRDTYLNLEYYDDLDDNIPTKVSLYIYDYCDYKHITVEYVEEMKEDYKKYLEDYEDLKEVGFVPISFEEFAGL